MVGTRRLVAGSVERQYAQAKGEIEFASLMARYAPAGDDDTLAELIEADGRARITLGKGVELRRYLDAVPDLAARQIPLDAAIDVTLRSLSNTSRPTAGAIRALAEQYPALQNAIRDAAALADAIWSTTGLRLRVETRPQRRLPEEFGPVLTAGGRRFELRQLLGTGGWGEVYLALDRQLSEPGHDALVAIKFLTAGDKSPWARQRLVEEATKARRVEDAGVVRVLDRGVSEHDEDYIVYEYVGGGDLGDWLKQRPRLAMAQAASLMATIARGVHAAHAAGLVHCDLKPGNVLMTADGRPKVADFGIAVRSGESGLAVGEDGQPLGNIAFISPEQFRGEEGSLTVASDIYALGGMLYFLLTGRLPNGESAAEITANHAAVGGRAAPPTLGGAGLRADRDLESVCARAMALRPRDRYSSAAALAEDLEAWLARRPIYWARPSAAWRARLWIKRNPAVAAALAGCVVIGIGAGALALHWSGEAALQRRSAARANGTLNAVRQGFENLTETASRLSGSASDDVTLPGAVMMEWTNGWKTLGVGGIKARDVETRRRLVLERLEILKAYGAAESYESVFWEGALAIWLLRGGAWDDAEKALAAAQTAVQKHWGDRDPWGQQLGMLHSVARTKQLLAKARQGALNRADRDELVHHERLIDFVMHLPKPLEPEGVVWQLGHLALVDLYGPRLLNDPAKLAARKAEWTPPGGYAKDDGAPAGKS